MDLSLTTKNMNKTVLQVIGLATLLALPVRATPETTLWYNRAADDYGLKSPLKCWEVENPSRTHKSNPDKAWGKCPSSHTTASSNAMEWMCLTENET